MDTAAFILSYCGPAPAPAQALWRWNFDPPLLAALAALSALIFAGHRFSRLEVKSDWAGSLAIAALLAAFVSPLCAMASALFSARVLHHILLVSAAAPLLAYGLGLRSPGGGWAAAIALLHALVFWFWHAPVAYEAALSWVPVYWLMQSTLLGSAVLLWAAIFRARPLSGIGLAAASMLQMGFLAALLTFSGQAIYTPHFGTAIGWGLTPLDDQQLGGALMWVAGGLGFFAAALWHAFRLLDQRQQAAC